MQPSNAIQKKFSNIQNSSKSTGWSHIYLCHKSRDRCSSSNCLTRFCWLMKCQLVCYLKHLIVMTDRAGKLLPLVRFITTSGLCELDLWVCELRVCESESVSLSASELGIREVFRTKNYPLNTDFLTFQWNPFNGDSPYPFKDLFIRVYHMYSMSMRCCVKRFQK